MRQALLGAEPSREGTRFRLWTDRARRAAVALVDASGAVTDELSLVPEGDGFFSRHVPGVGAGARYMFSLDEQLVPDPYARFLPDGVHAPAEVIDTRFAFRHHPRGLCLTPASAIYELHIGTFTPEGTYRAAAQKLPRVAELGVDFIELMPVAAFAGQRGWGYDGVALFAPFAPYGRPEELAALVDTAHALGLGVLLDVVYNHLGPDGNHLGRFSPAYTSSRSTPWGAALDVTHPRARQLVLDNVRYWLDAFRFDGLRLDATQAIFDPSARHIVAEITEIAHSLPTRRLIIAEDDRNDTRVVTDLGADAVWSDDFHHQVHVQLTGERDGYYRAFGPELHELAAVARRGWLYDGRISPLSGAPRGSPPEAIAPEQIVVALQNHDQIGNRAWGERLHHLVPRDAYHAASALLLFLPTTPLLFMGQEWAASTPFLYFTDHVPELGRAIAAGRRRELGRVGSDASGEALPDPQARSTFERSRLVWHERELPEHAATLRLYRRMLHLRRTDPVLAQASRRPEAGCDGSVLWVRRQLGEAARLLLVSFGEARSISDVRLPPGPWRVFDLIGERAIRRLEPWQAVMLAAP